MYRNKLLDIYRVLKVGHGESYLIVRKEDIKTYPESIDAEQNDYTLSNPVNDMCYCDFVSDLAQFMDCESDEEKSEYIGYVAENIGTDGFFCAHFSDEEMEMMRAFYDEWKKSHEKTYNELWWNVLYNGDWSSPLVKSDCEGANIYYHLLPEDDKDSIMILNAYRRVERKMEYNVDSDSLYYSDKKTGLSFSMSRLLRDLEDAAVCTVSYDE